jgi:hypothetical protein
VYGNVDPKLTLLTVLRSERIDETCVCASGRSRYRPWKRVALTPSVGTSLTHSKSRSKRRPVGAARNCSRYVKKEADGTKPAVSSAYVSFTHPRNSEYQP